MTPHRNFNGFSLIEVLVALLVLSLGLLGLAALQATSLAFNTDAYSRTQATVFVYDIVDKMRANPTGVTNGSYSVANASAASTKIDAYESCKASSCKCYGTASSDVCDTAELALSDLGAWYEKMKEALPGSASNLATIIPDAATANLITITISWLERDIPRSQTWVIQL